MYANDVKMSWEEVIEETRDFLSEEFEVDRNLILPENSLKDTLDLDSLDYVDLVVLIEENLNIKITGEDFKEIVTFGDFYRLVRKKLNL
ncbi:MULTISPECIES: phosphopantetheine-binding protein [Dyadobacter]|jgi:acyl carrier protein|uniref:Acyl carrier protein n=1 Tax=Dyadobacter chenhuakuii TaxID=2909339 RepID=A0A9X1Q8Z8_9BACT|nr:MULTISPECIES: phosphopantetheine-binding protein [Dyadobacter]MCE7070477.1 phosphopantetheine-binding protein [Dyadobacter sp. CY327]MCF2492774.1 phosphopantetheine-binding protein [Dyadobacter chenhuakuii]MCF2496821.1 phosphopantetheine-binding protein [Dyadobacter chenhuakuii]MCF2520837.1 phosphopantetheine-binding protein [Dyadobacter sp. CY351]USJ32935.1 phosphopantetheine-binding protein [Dyadobacter chenhuakuii]